VSDKRTKALLLAGFESGWAAAMLTIADQFKQYPETVDTLRRWANNPPPVETADLSTPEGQAMKRASETIFKTEVDLRDRSKS